ncbi:MAG: RNA-binding protein [Halothiobacillaceae bacterium]|jgi:RNA recognition motif-containing protein|nr:RNA-binding protein [Halothiobacillaceae bacterium]MDY0050675.1 RNA-binding protein [Halothiobacillaceae bacterium]
MNIYVGNLPYQLSEDELRDTFAEFGEVASAKIVKDPETGLSKGFGFVRMSEKEQGEEAIKSLDGQPFKGRPLRVNEARPREDRPDRGSAPRGPYQRPARGPRA